MSHVPLHATLALLMIASGGVGRSEILHDVEYRTVGNVILKMDAHIPSGRGPFPAAILVHGGGWISGDRHTTLKPLFEPLTKAGFAWFSIDYRLASDVTMFGAAIQDVQTAVSHVRSHASDYRIDPDQIVLIGESAGGHLVEMAALRGTKDTPVAAVVAFYAPSDLAELARTSRAVPENLRRALQSNWSDFVVAAVKLLSPIEHVSAGMPPLLLVHGTADRLVPPSQSARMCEAARAAGGSCDLVEIKGAGHGLRWWGPRDTADYQRFMFMWLQTHLHAYQGGNPKSRAL